MAVVPSISRKWEPSPRALGRRRGTLGDSGPLPDVAVLRRPSGEIVQDKTRASGRDGLAIINLIPLAAIGDGTVGRIRETESSVRPSQHAEDASTQAKSADMLSADPFAWFSRRLGHLDRAGSGAREA